MTEELLAELRRRTNYSGLTIVRGALLQKKLSCSFQQLQTALTELAEAKKVEILSPLPYAAVAILPRKWSGSSPRPVRNVPQGSSDSARVHKEVPVSSSAAAAAMQAREVGGRGEGGLLEEVLRVLGPEADRSEFAAILQGHSPPAIHRALGRVKNTRHIRVSKAALFRSLLEKFSQ